MILFSVRFMFTLNAKRQVLITGTLYSKYDPVDRRMLYYMLYALCSLHLRSFSLYFRFIVKARPIQLSVYI